MLSFAHYNQVYIKPKMKNRNFPMDGPSRQAQRDLLQGMLSPERYFEENQRTRGDITKVSDTPGKKYPLAKKK